MSDNWSWLVDTYWYVPEPYLPALLFDPSAAEPSWLVDQTVWQVQGAENGYFWGNCAALLTPKAGAGADSSRKQPSGMRFAGSITPDGSVHMSFMGDQGTTLGLGRCRWQGGAWTFEMQMSSGGSQLVLHWATMVQCQLGDPAWECLPGTDDSVPQFLADAGFEV